MIKIESVSVSRGGRPAVVDCSMTVKGGETVAIMGPNGAGKTTLLKLIAGLVEADGGDVDVEGVVGFAPDDPATGFFAETVSDEVAFFPRNRGLDVEHRCEEAMAHFDVAALAERDPYSLSVGQQRRVSLASVFAGEPDVVVIDEPTRGLAVSDGNRLTERLRAIDQSVVMATHDADFVYGAADRVVVLSEGQLQRVGDAREILRDERFLESVGIRPPGIVRWARRQHIDPPPDDLTGALEALEATS